MEEIILDASVLVKFFSQDERDDVVDELLSRYAKRKYSFIILDIAFYEIINAFKLSKKASKDFIKKALLNLLEMNPRIVSFSEKLIIEALEIMEKFPLTIYDALYIAQANLEKIPLLTADFKHHRKQTSKYIVFYNEFFKHF